MENEQIIAIIIFLLVMIAIISGKINRLATSLITATKGHLILTMLIILWLSAIVSSFLDNIPFVATIIPLILTLSHKE